MGGRGASSASSENKIIENSVNFQQVKTHIEGKYGCKFGRGMKQLPLENTKNVAKAIQAIEKDFPGITKDIEFYTGGGITSGWGAQAQATPVRDSNGNIRLSNFCVQLNRGFFKEQFRARAGDTVATNDKRGVVMHELGHIATYKIAGYNYVNYCKNVVQSAERSTGQKASNISRYAGAKVQEAVAEAFADIKMNGRNAQKISHSIYRQIKKDW